jgi:hypothetical protein
VARVVRPRSARAPQRLRVQTSQAAPHCGHRDVAVRARPEQPLARPSQLPFEMLGPHADDVAAGVPNPARERELASRGEPGDPGRGHRVVLHPEHRVAVGRRAGFGTPAATSSACGPSISNGSWAGRASGCSGRARTATSRWPQCGVACEVRTRRRCGARAERGCLGVAGRVGARPGDRWREGGWGLRVWPATTKASVAQGV